MQPTLEIKRTSITRLKHECRILSVTPSQNLEIKRTSIARWKRAVHAGDAGIGQP